jgi:hypothetical protein
MALLTRPGSGCGVCDDAVGVFGRLRRLGAMRLFVGGHSVVCKREWRQGDEVGLLGTDRCVTRVLFIASWSPPSPPMRRARRWPRQAHLVGPSSAAICSEHVNRGSAECLLQGGICRLLQRRRDPGLTGRRPRRPYPASCRRCACLSTTKAALHRVEECLIAIKRCCEWGLHDACARG